VVRDSAEEESTGTNGINGDEGFGLVKPGASCIIQTAARTEVTAFWQTRKIPPPSVLDGRAGG
jgi:hypothetical protein